MARRRTGSASDALTVGGVAVPRGERRTVDLEVARLPTHTALTIPVHVVHGSRPGTVAWISAAIHGDELNGIEIVRRVIERIEPTRLRGSLLAVPVVNVFGFLHQSRSFPDGRDLNRSFPGSRSGSLASRVAALFLREVASHCSHGIDLHTAAGHRRNLPQIRGDLDDPDTLAMAEAFGAPVILHARHRDGSLREAAARRGIPVLVYEAGEALRFDEASIRIGVRGVRQVMRHLGMLPGRADRRRQVGLLTARESQWIRAPRSGVLRLAVADGSVVARGQQVGSVENAFGEEQVPVRAPVDGTVIGRRVNPVVHQGDAILHLASGFPVGESGGAGR